VFANRARWSESQNVWVLESGWVRDFQDGSIEKYQKFTATALPELSEPPSYFNREVRQAFQLSFRSWELHRRVAPSRLRCFCADGAVVRKAGLSFDRAGQHVTGDSLRLPRGRARRDRRRCRRPRSRYRLLLAFALLEAMGGVGQLPPPFAAFAPDLVFYFLGMYSSSRCQRSLATR